MPAMSNGAYLDLDGAWEPGVLGLPTVDARVWGPKLRYHATRKGFENFYQSIVRKLPDFVLYGSGDFHHVTAALVRRWTTYYGGKFTILSFDNHPDWDIRPPRWSCGGWVHRALKNPNVTRVSVWGCGNFELALPSRLFRDRRAIRRRRLEINAWAERQSPANASQFDCMTREDWKERMHDLMCSLKGHRVYVTVDLDCLRDDEIITDWENGLFSAKEVARVLEVLGHYAVVVGGDICGSRSPQVYERRFQRLAGRWDHPKLPEVPLHQVRRHNLPAVQMIWRALAEAGPLSPFPMLRANDMAPQGDRI